MKKEANNTESKTAEILELPKISELKKKIESQKIVFDTLNNLFKNRNLFLSIKDKILELKKIINENTSDDPKVRLVLIHNEEDYRNKTEFSISNTDLVLVFLSSLEEKTILKLQEVDDQICSVSSNA